MCPVRLGVFYEIEGEFLVDSAYSELPSLLPKLSDNVISLSGLEGGLEDVI